jgi:hypothetical protein
VAAILPSGWLPVFAYHPFLVNRTLIKFLSQDANVVRNTLSDLRWWEQAPVLM